MKKLTISFLCGCLAFGIFYLVGSFFSASFDLSTWGDTARGVCASFGVMAFIAAFTAGYNEYDDFNKRKL